MILPFYHSGMARVLPYRAMVPRAGHSVHVMVGQPLDLSHITCKCNQQGGRVCVGWGGGRLPLRVWRYFGGRRWEAAGRAGVRSPVHPQTGGRGCAAPGGALGPLLAPWAGTPDGGQAGSWAWRGAARRSWAWRPGLTRCRLVWVAGQDQQAVWSEIAAAMQAALEGLAPQLPPNPNQLLERPHLAAEMEAAAEKRRRKRLKRLAKAGATPEEQEAAEAKRERGESGM